MENTENTNDLTAYISAITPAGDKGCPFGAMGSLLPGNQV